MSAQNRPTTGWSTTSKSTGFSNQTAPLVTTRRKLFRPITNNQRSSLQRVNKSKHDIEELFKLYYSDDIKFDPFQKQILTGKRIPTVRAAPSSAGNTLTDIFDSKHCVTREQLSTIDLSENEQKPMNKDKTINPVELDRTTADTMVNLSLPTVNPSIPTSITTHTTRNLPEPCPLTEQHELYDPPLVKSVTFLEDNFNKVHENTNTQKRSPISSASPIPSRLAPPSLPSRMLMNNNNRKDPSVSSHASMISIVSSQQQQQQQQQQLDQPTIVTGSAVTVRQRSSGKQIWNGLRPKSNITTNTNSSTLQSSLKTRPTSINSFVSIESDIIEPPVHIGTKRVVSIPSKCSRYVLVTFPEVPLTYHPPSYVERLLLSERFPTLFHNIVHSYDRRHPK